MDKSRVICNSGQIPSSLPEREQGTVSEKACLFVLFLYLLVDPAGQLFGLKEELFAATLAYLFLLYALEGEWSVSTLALIITCMFITVPLLSIYGYLLRNGDPFYFGFAYLRTFVLIVLTLALVSRRVNAVPILAYALALYSVVGLVIILVLISSPALLFGFRLFGEQTSLFFYDIRVYGPFTLHSYYFSVSPMVVFSCAYFLSNQEGTKIEFWLGVASLVFMVLCGTRGNYIGAILVTVIVFHIRFKLSLIVWIGLGISSSTLILAELLSLMLDSENKSNAYKIDYLPHYAEILDQPLNAIFGTGLGAYYDFKNGAGAVHTTELTYLEIFRYFGVPLGVILLILMVGPMILWKNTSGRAQDGVTVRYGYGVYLLMSAVNPLFFSSTGMTLYTVALATAVLSRTNSHKKRRC